MGRVVSLRAQQVDEYGELCRQIAELRPVMDRKAELEREIASWYDGADAAGAFEEAGQVYIAQISRRKRERRVTSIPKLFAILGKSRFLQFCTFPLAAIDRLVPEASHGDFLSDARSGSRTVTTVAKSPARRAA